MLDSAAHYQRLYRETPAEFRFTAKSPEEVAAWQAAFRPRLEQLLGLPAIRQSVGSHVVRAEQLSVEPQDGYVRERWLLHTEPDVPLPFYVIRPAFSKGPLPLVITPHGHNHPHIYAGIWNTEDEKSGLVEGERDIAVQAARLGYLALAPTTRGFGDTRTAADRAEDKLSSCRTRLMHGLLVGRTPQGERVWDMMRLIDWALATQNIDPKRIAMTGNSGGGTVTLYASAIDTRISVSVPSCSFATYAGSIGSIGHCDCNYVPGIMRLGEIYDIAGLIAPRPFCALAGVLDDIFPIDHVRLACERLRKVYETLGVADRCRLYEGPAGHRYYSDGAWPFVKEWFAA